MERRPVRGTFISLLQMAPIFGYTYFGSLLNLLHQTLVLDDEQADPKGTESWNPL